MPHRISASYLSKTLKFQQLQLVSELSKTLSLVHAAEKLNITQSAASKILKKLESTLEVELFERHARGMKPTDFGLKFIKHAKIILAQLRYSADELEDLKSGNLGHINVGTLLAGTAVLLPNTLARITRDYPDLKISVLEGTNDKLFPELKVGELDIIVGRISIMKPELGLTQQYLYDDPIRLVCSTTHPLSKVKTKNLKLVDLMNFNWILPIQGTDLRAEIDKSFANQKLPLPSHSIESVSIMTNLTLLQQGDFIAALPTQFISPFVEQGLIYVIPLRLESTLAPVGYTIRNIEMQSPALSIFMKYLHETTRQYKNRG
jgi:DNA-binding transcriptional LysR family regulator